MRRESERPIVVKKRVNERGAKGPQFQGNRTSGKRDEIGESLSPQANLWKRQERLHEKAKGNPRSRFYALYDKIYGASGVDRVSLEEIEARERGVEGRLGELAQAHKGKRYRPDAVRRVYNHNRHRMHQWLSRKHKVKREETRIYCDKYINKILGQKELVRAKTQPPVSESMKRNFPHF